MLLPMSLLCTTQLQWLENARGRAGLAAEAGRVQDAVDTALLVGQARSFSGPGAVLTAALVARERAAATSPKERERGQGHR